MNVTLALMAGWLLITGPTNASGNTPDAGATLWRWIGILDNPMAGCPAPHPVLGSGWSTRPLFNSSSLSTCPDLGLFCVWEYDGSSGPITPDTRQCLDELDGIYEHGIGDENSGMPCRAPKLMDAEPDAMVLTSAAGQLSTKLWPELEQLFLEQAGKTTLPTYPPSAPEVWLTLLDTSPTSGTPEFPQSSPHGEALSAFAQTLLCDSQSGTSPDHCVALIRNRLALPYKSFDPFDPRLSERDELQGGYFGLISELGEKLVEELDDWVASGSSHLILNLSIAWDRQYGGATPAENMPPSVQAVYRALECTACQDNVMVVAAAGNFADLHPENDHGNPLFPAAWTEIPTSPRPGCDVLRPLLYAVGGFDARRNNLSNALDQGMPEFAAYGDHTVIGTDRRHPTATLTGSSSSTLVVSATAAAVAYYAPTSSSNEIMQSLYEAGDTSERTADFWQSTWGGSPPKIKYVSLCKSVHRVCQGSCPVTLTPCAGRPLRLPAFSTSPLLSTTTPTADASVPFSYPNSGSQNPETNCGSDFPLYHLDPMFVGEPCPRRQFYALAREPGSHPQPQSNFCPTCLFVPPAAPIGTGAFYAEIEIEGDRQLKNPTLHLNCGISMYNYSAPFSVLEDGDTFILQGLPATCQTGMFSYSVHNLGGLGNLGSVTVPILFGIGPP